MFVRSWTTHQLSHSKVSYFSVEKKSSVSKSFLFNFMFSNLGTEEAVNTFIMCKKKNMLLGRMVRGRRGYQIIGI